MTPLVLSVERQVSDLHRFIGTLLRSCSDMRSDYPVFSESSRKFFNYIALLARETQGFLEKFPADFSSSRVSQLAHSKRQKLISIKEAWENLHDYIRPALDADSLHLPTSLIAAFQDMIANVKDCEDFRFVPFHTTEANYLQIPAGMAKDVANGIAHAVGGTFFPEELCLIGLPYSQADGCFMNCLLLHEMAHKAFQETFEDKIREKVAEVLGELEKQLGILTNLVISASSTVFESWAEEVFCDLFAICLLGPAYSFAFCELVGGSMLIDARPGEPANAFTFSADHPADVARLYAQKQMLVRLGWWPVIKDSESAPVKVLASSDTWSEYFFIENPYLDENLEVKDGDLLEQFRILCDWLIESLHSYFGTLTADFLVSFERQAPVIKDYLSQAVVPSTIFCEGKLMNPDPRVLINAGYAFSLEHLESLAENIRGYARHSVAARSYLTERLEMWILKALEDHRLLSRQVPQ